MSRILITNDDGIRADGLTRLAAAARAFGEVWIVAPDRQKSAASHSITLDRHIDVRSYDFSVPGVRAFSCTGTPADCIRVGIRAVLPEMPDLVLAGINYGYNAGSDIQYSATVGAAFEAEFQGIPAIAFSEDSSGLHETTDLFLSAVLEELIPVRTARGQVWNVNFPGCPAEECRGILRDRAVSGHMVYDDDYPVQERLADGIVRYKVVGRYIGAAEEGTDFRALLDRYVSIGTVRNLS